VAERLGFAEAFSFGSEADVFREHAALSAFENDGTRDFDLGGLAQISDDAYDALEPVQWPIRAGEASQPAGKRFFAEGSFFTPDRKARFVPPEAPCLAEATSPDFPFRLNTGRIRDQWHTMTRTGQSPRLAAHLAEPFVEVHPRDAAGLEHGGFARVSTAHGSAILKVSISENQQPGSLFAPIHWSAETASAARIGELVSPRTDPYSGQPEAKATPAQIAPVEFALAGFIRARAPVEFPPDTWWARVAVASGVEYRVASSQGPLIWHDFAYRSFGTQGELAEALEGSTYQAAVVLDGEVEGCVCVTPVGERPQWNLERLVNAAAALGGVARVPKSEACAYIGGTESIICACFQVPLAAVRAAVNSGAAKNVRDLGKTLRAGTNCGSCLPELKRIIVDERIAHPV
jgi:assimilatory nitrate reductase catalytic subunit